MEIRAGTSGFSYKVWKGTFYPADLAQKAWLAYYAERLPSVEINNTFYRLPRASVLESWGAQVPATFRFALKASRRITHFKRLKAADDETGYLLRTVEALGDRLGALLFQLSPKLQVDTERLDRFLEILPEGTPAAFEFRHPSWWDDAVFERLRARNCALVAVDAAEGEGDAGEVASDLDSSDLGSSALVSTADWGYLRLRRPDYERADLADWAQRIRAQGWRHAFLFFKHEEDGAGPRIAAEFLDVARRIEQRREAIPLDKRRTHKAS